MLSETLDPKTENRNSLGAGVGVFCAVVSANRRTAEPVPEKLRAGTNFPEVRNGAVKDDESDAAGVRSCGGKLMGGKSRTSVAITMGGGPGNVVVFVPITASISSCSTGFTTREENASPMPVTAPWTKFAVPRVRPR
jgi:hypothetical protein